MTKEVESWVDGLLVAHLDEPEVDHWAAAVHMDALVVGSQDLVAAWNCLTVVVAEGLIDKTDSLPEDTTAFCLADGLIASWNMACVLN